MAKAGHWTGWTGQEQLRPDIPGTVKAGQARNS
jgi:hypothetical protein